MSNLRFSRIVNAPRNHQEKMDVVTSKQYLDLPVIFLRKLFPEITSDRLPDPGPFTVFIADDERVRH